MTLVGYSPWGLQKVRHNCVTKHTLPINNVILSSLCTSHPIPALVLSLGYKYLPLERFYCVVPSFSFAGLKAAPKCNQTVQSQQCNLVVSLGNYLTKPFFQAIYSLSHKLPIKFIFQHPPNPAPFPFSSFQFPSNSYSSSLGKCLHFSLHNPTILLIDMNQKTTAQNHQDCSPQ